MLKRAHKGMFHKINPKHLDRYVQEFAGKHNLREQDTLAQMAIVALGLSGKRLKYRELIADNGRSSGRGHEQKTGASRRSALQGRDSRETCSGAGQAETRKGENRNETKGIEG